MTDKNLIWPESDETANARIEQAQSIKPIVAEAGLRFEVYLPPDLALWILEQVERGDFIDPSEAAFVRLQDAMELNLHSDLGAELLKRKLSASIQSVTSTEITSIENIFDEVGNKETIEPPFWRKIIQPE